MKKNIQSPAYPEILFNNRRNDTQLLANVAAQEYSIFGWEAKEITHERQGALLLVVEWDASIQEQVPYHEIIVPFPYRKAVWLIE